MVMTNKGFNGTVDEAAFAFMGRIGMAEGVESPAAWAVTQGAGRQVSVAAQSGWAFGEGVVSKETVALTASLGTPTNGQWYLIVRRINWATDTVTIVAIPHTVTGTTVPTTAPAGLPTMSSTPGTEWDQKLAWAWVRSTDTTMFLVDLRKQPLEDRLAGFADLATVQAIIDALYLPGDFRSTARTAAPAGWLMVPQVPTNVLRVGTYAALFAAIGTKYGAGDGSTTFGLPVIPVGGSPVQARPSDANLGTATFTNASDLVTVTAHGLVDGQRVYFTGGTAPTGLSLSTRYYVINATSSTFQLALTKGGAAINFTTDGTGTRTAFNPNFTLGEGGGEDTHLQSRNEVGIHDHDLFMGRGGAADGNRISYFDTNANLATSAAPVADSAGGYYMNNMQPYTTANWLIRI